MGGRTEETGDDSLVEYCCPTCHMPGVHFSVMVFVREGSVGLEYVEPVGDRVYSWYCPVCLGQGEGAPNLIRGDYSFDVSWRERTGAESIHDAERLVQLLYRDGGAALPSIKSLASLAAVADGVGVCVEGRIGVTLTRHTKGSV